MKSFFVLLLAVALGIVGGALWSVVMDSYATAAEPPKRSGLVERMKANRADRQRPVRERITKLRTRIAQRRDRRLPVGPGPATAVATPSQTGAGLKAPRVDGVARCPSCGLVRVGVE